MAVHLEAAPPWDTTAGPLDDAVAEVGWTDAPVEVPTVVVPARPRQ